MACLPHDNNPLESRGHSSAPKPSPPSTFPTFLKGMSHRFLQPPPVRPPGVESFLLGKWAPAKQRHLPRVTQQVAGRVRTEPRCPNSLESRDSLEVEHEASKHRSRRCPHPATTFPSTSTRPRAPCWHSSHFWPTPRHSEGTH